MESLPDRSLLRDGIKGIKQRRVKQYDYHKRSYLPKFPDPLGLGGSAIQNTNQITKTEEQGTNDDQDERMNVDLKEEDIQGNETALISE